MKKNYIALLMGVTLFLNINGTVSAETVSATSNIMQGTGWVQQNGNWYYLKSDGSHATGWIKDGVDSYYFWSNGTMATGWVKSGNDWYYLCSSGAMASNTVIDGYYLNSNGAWVTKPGQPIYNGIEIAKKLSDIGFFYKNGSYIINKYGQQGASQFKYISYSVHSGDTDMNLSVYASTSETDQKIKAILNWILPTQGSYLYNLMDNANFKSQILELDGRTVSVTVEKTYVSINFSPIK